MITLSNSEYTEIQNIISREILSAIGDYELWTTKSWQTNVPISNLCRSYDFSTIADQDGRTFFYLLLYQCADKKPKQKRIGPYIISKQWETNEFAICLKKERSLHG